MTVGSVLFSLFSSFMPLISNFVPSVQRTFEALCIVKIHFDKLQSCFFMFGSNSDGWCDLTLIYFDLFTSRLFSIVLLFICVICSLNLPSCDPLATVLWTLSLHIIYHVQLLGDGCVACKLSFSFLSNLLRHLSLVWNSPWYRTAQWLLY